MAPHTLREMMTIPKKAIAALSVAGLFTLSACGGGWVPVPDMFNPHLPDPVASTVTVDFNNGIDGWHGDVADYRAGNPPTEVAFAWKDLPAPLSGKGYYMASHNDKVNDVLTYVTRQLDGFVKNTHYDVTFELRYATNAGAGCGTASRGDNIYMVAAASYNNIETVLQPGSRAGLNLDRGNQGVSGTMGKVLGTQGVPGLACDGGTWVSTTTRTSEPIKVSADKDGRFWIMLGNDSGFEGTNAVYLQGATVRITPH